MKATRLPSGKWRAQYVIRYDVVNGKRKVVRGSVTRDTKTDAVKAATMAEKVIKNAPVTIGKCIDDYIRLKESVLSPSTIRSYKALQANAFGDIAHLTPSEATGAVLQAWVSKYSTTHAPKAVRNAYALLCASVRLSDPAADMSATLPQKVPPEYTTPTDDDIKKLLDSAKGTELEKAVLLAAFGTLRRGEVSALKKEDIEGCTVHVRRSVAELRGGGTVEKSTKTPQSIRAVTLPQSVIETLLDGVGDGERVCKLSPTAISDAFRRAAKKAGVAPFRFHDLRAYSASVRHALGIPNSYIKAAGGWRSDRVLEQAYRRTMDDREQTFTDLANDHFEKLCTQKSSQDSETQ